jgi:hypothetical protein
LTGATTQTPPQPSGTYVIGRVDDTLAAAQWIGNRWIYNPPKGTWNWPANEVWVKSVIDQRAKVYLGSPINHFNLWDEQAKQARPYSKEIKMFLDAGYQFRGNYLVPPP